MGKIDISLTENQVKQDEDGHWILDTSKPVTSEGLTFTDVYPGETVEKNPTVHLEQGSGSAYIRIKMKLDSEGSSFTESDMEALEQGLHKEIEADGKWKQGTDGYYYYNQILTSKEDSAVFFETVTLPGKEWGNNTENQKFSIKLQAEAIQSDHFTPQTEDGKIVAWVDANGNPVEAEANTADQ
nr:hypothetical protein [uncultured Sellimonas sp.]